MGRSDDVFASTSGALYIADPAGTLKPKGHVSARIITTGRFEYILQLLNDDDVVLVAVPINNDLNLQFKDEDILEFILQRPNYRVQRIRLICEEDLYSFRAAVAQALFESFSGQSLADAIEESDREWLIKTTASAVKDKQTDPEFEMDDEDQPHYRMDDEDEPVFYDVPTIEEERTKRKGDSSDEEEEDEEDARSMFRSGNYNTPAKSKGIRDRGSAMRTSTRKGKEENNILVSGTNLNRSFVSRGAQLGVFGYSEDDELQYLNRLKGVKTSDGQLVIPKEMQLHGSDKNMLMLDRDNMDKIYNVDLERGVVVDSWEGMEGMKFNKIAPRSKYAQTTDEQMIVGTSDNGIFSIDPRINEKNKIAESFFYKTKVNLESVTTTDSGYTAVASKTGEIRLFNKIGKGYCKTQLPSLGSKVDHVDVTADGTWMVATTKSYLLIFPLVLPSGKTGFETRMGQEKPTPLKLTISPEDQAKYNIKTIEFTPAKFNTGTIANTTEKWIATSTGPWVITWNFDKVKIGDRNAYKIKRTDEHVVMDVFRHNHQNELVVAQSDDVFLSKIKNKK